MKAILKKTAILLACQIWGISAFYLFPEGRLLAKLCGNPFALIPTILVSLSCSVNEKICDVFNLTTDFPNMRGVPISLPIQIVLYLILGILILLAKPRKKRIAPAEANNHSLQS